MSRGPKLREKCLNLCPPLPAVHPLFSLASSLSFDARRGELNRSWLPLFSSLEIICGYPLSSFASSTFPSLPLFSPLFIIIRFYRSIELPVQKLPLSESELCVLLIRSVANLLATFPLPLSLLPPRCFRCLHALIEHLVLAAPAPWDAVLSRSNPVFPTRY